MLNTSSYEITWNQFYESDNRVGDFLIESLAKLIIIVLS